MSAAGFLVLGSGSGVGPRPAPQRQKPLPPWEASDDSGLVHTTQPPDLVIPSGPDRRFFRGGFGSTMLPQAVPLGMSRADQITFAQSIGANTTPLEMSISFLLPYYRRFGTASVDVFLTAHAKRGYSHFLLDLHHCYAAGFSVSDVLALVAYVQSWGFFVSMWLTGTNDDRSRGWASVQGRVEPVLRGVLNDSGITERFISLPGEELNGGGCPPGPAGCDSIIAAVCALCNPSDVDVWLHFTSNYPGYPENAGPGEDPDAKMVQWIAQWRGRVRGLAWQSEPTQSAGLQGAKLWDARRFWARAGYIDYPCVAAFELTANEALYGRFTEEQACLRGLELLYCTSDGSAPPVAGVMDGLRLPNGDPL